MDSHKLLKRIFGFFGILGISVIICAVVLLVVSICFPDKSESVTVTATVTSIEEYKDSKGSIRHRVYVSYTYDGEDYENVPINFYSSKMYEGREIEIRHYTDRESRNLPVGGMRVASVILFFFGAFNCMVGFLPIGILKGIENKNKKLLETGRTLYAEVDRVEINTSIVINHRCPYVVYCHYTDPYTNEVYRFQSGNILTDPSPYLSQGSEVPVVVKEGNYSIYYVDVEKMMNGRAADPT